MTRYAVICILIHGLWPMVWLDGQGFVIKMIQKLMARGCEKQIYIRTLLGKHVKFFVSHVVCHAMKRPEEKPPRAGQQRSTLHIIKKQILPSNTHSLKNLILRKWGKETLFIEHKMNASCSQMDYFINYPNGSLQDISTLSQVINQRFRKAG